MHVKQLPLENSCDSGRNLQRGPNDGILQGSYAKTCLEIRLGGITKSANRRLVVEGHQAIILGAGST